MLSVALLAVETPVFAAEVQQASRSAGKLKQDQGIDLAAELEQRELVVKDRPEAPENYAESPTAQRLEGVANRHDQLFEIYDADVQLTADFDGDGYHHALNVVFDVDVSYDAATVYAKLYLSREGEPLRCAGRDIQPRSCLHGRQRSARLSLPRQGHHARGPLLGRGVC
jgi:hypothetical protein